MEVDWVMTVVDSTWVDILSVEDSSNVPRIVMQNTSWIESCLAAHTTQLQQPPGAQGTSVSELWRVFISDQVMVDDSRLNYFAGFADSHDSFARRSVKNEADLSKSYDNLRPCLQLFKSGGRLRSLTSSIIAFPDAEIQLYLKRMASVCAHRRSFITRYGRLGLVRSMFEKVMYTNFLPFHTY